MAFVVLVPLVVQFKNTLQQQTKGETERLVTSERTFVSNEKVQEQSLFSPPIVSRKNLPAAEIYYAMRDEIGIPGRFHFGPKSIICNVYARYWFCIFILP